MLRKKLFVGLILSIGILIFSQNVLRAQGTQVTFGQNRVQYHDFVWQYFESENFVTYFYPGGQELGKFVVLASEERLKFLEDRMDYRINTKIDILVYNDITDMAQTNIGIGNERFNLGGTAKIIDNKLFLYYDGNHNHLLRDLQQGLADLFIKSMMAGSGIGEVLQNAVFLNLPDWYQPGLAAFMGEEWNTDLDNKLRLYFHQNKKKSFNKLAQEEPQFAGHALWNYIHQTYGKGAIQNILYLTRINRSVDNGFSFSVGASLAQVVKNFEDYYTFHYAQDTTGRTIPGMESALKIKIKKKQDISGLKISPDGRNLIYAIHKGGAFKVFVRDLETKKKKKITSGGFKSDNYPFDKSYPIMAWTPGSTGAAVVFEKRDQVKIYEYDLLKKKKVKDDLRGFQRIHNIAFAGDGRTLVMSAQNKGQTDIYTYYIPSQRVTQLTNDYFDDLEPAFSSISGVKGIFFTSNRPTASLDPVSMDTLLPIGDFNLYFYNLDNPDARLSKVTNSSFAFEKSPRTWNEEKFVFTSDENGIRNLYEGKLDSFLIRTDTVLTINDNNVDTLEIKPIYGFKSSIRPITDLPYNLRDADFAFKVSKAAFIVDSRKRPAIYITRLTENKLPQVLSSSAYKLTWENSFKAVQQKPAPVSGEAVQKEINDELNSLIEQDFPYTFESAFDYTLNREEKIDTVTADSVVVGSDNNGEIDVVEFYQKEEKQITTLPTKSAFRQAGIVAYRAKFSSDYVVTQLDNSILPFSYQSFSLDGPVFNYPDLSGLITFGVSDLMEDHKLVGGFRLPTNLDGTEVFASYENLKHRLDKRLLFYRRSNKETYGLQTGTFVLPVIGKQKTNYMEARLSWPFDVTKSLKFYGAYRNDRLLLAYTDSITLGARIDVKENWSLMKLEFIQDNSKEVQLNIFNGFRYKFYTEYFRNWSASKSNLFTVGFDIRHYLTIHKNIIWANRLAGATSFGQQKIVYYLGGVDTWINSRFDNNIPVSNTQNYAFQTLATNMRGFSQNIRNGNSYTVLNSEIRFPFVSYFAKKPLKSSFIRNMQLVGFFDIGAAYKGITPFDEQNPFSNEQVTANGNQTPVVVSVDYYRNPTVMGLGGGFRTTLLGYFIRVDAAWGIDGFISDKPQWLFSLSKDF